MSVDRLPRQPSPMRQAAAIFTVCKACLIPEEFRRAYWRRFWRAVNDATGPMRPSQIFPISDLTYHSLQANHVTNSSTDLSTVTLQSWITNRYRYITNQLSNES